MSSNDIRMGDNIWQQTKWKLKAYNSGFTTVVVVQILFSLFFLSVLDGMTHLSTGNMYMNLQVSIFSIDGVLMFSLIACLIVSLIMASQGAWHENMSVVTTRITATLSTVVYFIILSAVATLTAVSSFYIAVWLAQQFHDTEWIASDYLLPLRTYVICFVLHLVATACGFLAGIALEKSKLLFTGGVLAGFFIVPYVLFWNLKGSEEISEAEPMNYYAVSSVLFMIAIVLYTLAIWIRSRQEVR